MVILLALFIAFLSTFLLVLNQKEKWAVYLILFFIPYNIIEIKYIGFNYFLLFGLIIGNVLLFLRKKQKWISDYAYKSNVRLIYFSLLLGIIMLFLVDMDYNITIYNNLSKLESSVLFIIFFIMGIMFYKTILRTINSYNDFINYLLVFMSSALLLFISWLNYQFSFSIPKILQRRISEGGWSRFSGFWGDYELTNEYLFIVMIFSLLILFKKNIRLEKKIIALVSFSASFPIAITTGTRSLFVMVLMFVVIAFVSIQIIPTIKFKTKLLSVSFFGGFLLFGYIIFSNNFPLTDRLMETYNLYMSSSNINIDSFQLLINRNYTDTYQDIIFTGGYFGVGPFFVHFVGNSIFSWMVYHSLYYHIIINFGLIGLGIYLFFFNNLLKDLLKQILLGQNQVFLIVLFSLIISLLFDQFKVNYFREPSHMLTYWFIFGVVAVINKKNILIINK